MASNFDVTVKQYYRPDGRSSYKITELPDHVKYAYVDMVAAGCWFEAEVLTNGIVSQTVTDRDSDLDIELCENGPNVQASLVKLLERGSWRKPHAVL
jgi:hypothetical protein